MNHGATLKHKCGKRIVTLSLLSFCVIFFSIFYIFFGLGLSPFLWPLFFYFSSGVSSRLVRESWSPSSFPHLGQCSNNDDHHTFIYLQLMNYNSILRTKYDSMWMPPAVYRDMQWIKSDMYERIMNGGFATNTMSTTWSCKTIWQWWSVSLQNGTVENCMAIYLGMAMEMPW